MPVPHQWKPKVNRHVDYRKAGGRRRPGIITAVVSGTTVNIRVGHHTSAETYSNVTPGKGDGHYRAG